MTGDEEIRHGKLLEKRRKARLRWSEGLRRVFEETTAPIARDTVIWLAVCDGYRPSDVGSWFGLTRTRVDTIVCLLERKMRRKAHRTDMALMRRLIDAGAL